MGWMNIQGYFSHHNLNSQIQPTLSKLRGPKREISSRRCRWRESLKEITEEDKDSLSAPPHGSRKLADGNEALFELHTGLHSPQRAAKSQSSRPSNTPPTHMLVIKGLAVADQFFSKEHERQRSEKRIKRLASQAD